MSGTATLRSDLQTRYNVLNVAAGFPVTIAADARRWCIRFVSLTDPPAGASVLVTFSGADVSLGRGMKVPNGGLQFKLPEDGNCVAGQWWVVYTDGTDLAVIESLWTEG